MAKLRHSSVVALVLALLSGFVVRLIIAVLDGSVLPEHPLVTRGIGAGLALVAIWMIEGELQQRSLQDTAFAPRHAARDLLRGVAAGSALMFGVVGVLWLSGWYTAEAAVFRPAAWLGRAALLLFGAVFEEALFRGLVFRRMEAVLGSWLSLLVVGALFGLPHLANPGATVWSTLSISAGGGLMLGAACMATGNLWLAVGIHWAWNAVQGLIFGLAVSGMAGVALLDGRVQGPSLWTGGAFGPEAGLLALLFPALAGGLLVRSALAAGRVVRPAWARARTITHDPLG